MHMTPAVINAARARLEQNLLLELTDPLVTTICCSPILGML